MSIFSKVGRAVIGVSKNPDFLVYSGIAVGIFAGVEFCKSSLKAEEIINETKKDFEVIKTAAETHPEEYDKNTEYEDTIKACIKAAVRFAKLYGKPTALAVLSIFFILKGHGILKQKYSDVVAYAVGLEQSYKTLFNRVSEEMSEDAAKKFASGIRNVEYEFEEADENGEVKKRKENINIIDEDSALGPYEWIFGPDSNAWVSDNFDLNTFFIKSQCTNANDILIQREGQAMSVSDVFAEAHIFNCPRDFYSAGWKLPKKYYTDTCEPYIYWDVEKVYKDYGEGPVPVLKVNFNCDGFIWDKMPEKKK